MTTSCVGIFNSLFWSMALPQQLDDIRLNEQQEVEALLGSPPGGLLRWGMGALAGFFVLLAVLAWFVRYPDVLRAPVILTTENAPLRMQALQNGAIQLFVQDGASVEAGQRLAVLQSSAAISAITRLENWLEEQASLENPGDILAVSLPENVQLGSLQPDFSAFRQNWERLRFALSENQVAQKITVLQQQKQQLQTLRTALRQQQTTLTEEVALSRQQFERTRELFEKEAMSQLEVDIAQRNFLQTRRQLEAIQTQLAQNDLQQSELQLQILDLRQAEQTQLAEQWQTLQTSLQNLQASIEVWKEHHLFIAPADGQILLTGVKQSGDFVQANQIVFTFLPRAANRIVGKANLPVAGAGKVEVGDTVNIQLADFPYREFGQLRGAVTAVAPIVEQNTYELTIEVPQDLETTYGIPLPFKQEMQGRVEVVTEKRRLLARIVDRGRSVLQN